MRSLRRKHRWLEWAHEYLSGWRVLEVTACAADHRGDSVSSRECVRPDSSLLTRKEAGGNVLCTPTALLDPAQDQAAGVTDAGTGRERRRARGRVRRPSCQWAAAHRGCSRGSRR
jgi:hypothetical protein